MAATLRSTQPQLLYLENNLAAICNSFPPFGAQSRKIKQQTARPEAHRRRKKPASPPHNFMPFSGYFCNRMKTHMLRMNWSILTPSNKELT
jgi:hypothetical protein